jgi:branched-chain amino acid transport system substrate-binding protein
MRRALAVAVVAAALPACASAATALKVGAVYPRTGSQGEQGSEEYRGVALAAQWANDHHVLPGRTITLVPEDAPRAEAVDRVMASLQARGVRLVVGSHGSAVSAAAADSATARHMLFWETGAVGQISQSVKGGRAFFRLAPMGANLGHNAIAFMAAERVPQPGLRYGIAHVDDAYGRAVAQGAADEIAARGLRLSGDFAYPATGADYDALARRIAAAHVDVLFVAAYLDDGVALREAMVRDGVRLTASIGTSSSYCHPAFGDRLGADAVGLFASDKPDAADVRADALRPEARSALAWVQSRYRARYHEDMSAPALSGFSNALALFAHVLPAAAHLTPADVAAAALRVKLPEGSLANGGGMDLAPPGALDAGENRAASGVIWEWVAPRTRAVVWPPAFATHPIADLPLA